MNKLNLSKILYYLLNIILIVGIILVGTSLYGGK